MVSEIEPKEKQTKKRGRKPKVIKEEKKAMPSVSKALCRACGIASH